MDINHWFLIFGLFLIILVLGEDYFTKGPLSPAMLYLAFGFILGPKALNVFDFNILNHAEVMEVGTEIVVIISLFSAGLKMQFSFRHLHWKISALLASGTMVLTVSFIATLSHFVFSLPWGAAILLGGILAPTDPVLASDVQVKDEDDDNLIRRSITGEAGMNDGTAFPVIMLGLTLLGARWMDSESPLLNWALADFLWAIPGALAIGYICGWLTAKLIVLIHARKDKELLIIEDFASIGLIAASYGLAQVASTYGFLSVFAAAVAFARIESQYFEKNKKDSGQEDFSSSLMRFSTQLERVGEIAAVVLVGYVAGILNYEPLVLLLPLLLFLVIRPLAVYLVLGRLVPKKENMIISWFGIRGIGSIYYMSYALNHGLEGEPSRIIFNLVMVTIVISIFFHGMTASPVMKRLEGEKN